MEISWLRNRDSNVGIVFATGSSLGAERVISIQILDGVCLLMMIILLRILQVQPSSLQCPMLIVAPRWWTGIDRQDSLGAFSRAQRNLCLTFYIYCDFWIL